MKRVIIAAFALAVIAIAPKANAQDKDPMVGGAAMYPTKNIVENAVNSKDHTTLVAAVKAAGLVETLESAGPFTVFAPTDEAFNKLPAGTVDTLLKPENKEKLRSILLYHVVAGDVTATKVMKMSSAKTLDGQNLNVMVNDGTVMVNDAKVIKADVMASNGVIHVIDTVLIPKN